MTDAAWQKQAYTILNLTIGEKSGHLGRLTYDEEQVLREFRETHRDRKLGDQDLLRFLRARQFNPKKAGKMLNDTCAWRAENNPDPAQLRELAHIARQGLGLVQGLDRVGRPVLWFYFRHHDPAQHDQAWRFTIALLELAIRRLPLGMDGITICFDLTGYNRKNVDIKWATKAIQTLQNHYPERMGMTLMINAPSFFSMVWRIIRPFIDSRTSAKILFVDGGNWQAKLLDLIDSQNLPTVSGGAMDIAPSAWIDRLLASGETR